MGAPDKVEAKRQEDLQKRKGKKKSGGENNKETNKKDHLNNKVAESESENDEHVDVDTEKDEDFVFVDSRRAPSVQNRNNIENYISEVERYGISDRAAASLFNAAQRDLKIITDGKDKDAVDKFKIRRSRTSYRLKQKAKMKKKVEDSGGLGCLGVDGKRDKKTRKRVIQLINGTEVEKDVVEFDERLAYTMERSGEYLCHSAVSANKGTGRGLADDFIEVLAENHSRDTIEAVVADGTNTNTGWNIGFIAYVERDLRRNLIWLICMVHGNDLPMRHLFAHCDGVFGTSGPDIFKGPIGHE